MESLMAGFSIGVLVTMLLTLVVLPRDNEVYTKLCNEIKWESPSCAKEKQNRLGRAGLVTKPSKVTNGK